MNPALAIANALLDSQAEQFMRSFKEKRPMRYEFTLAHSGIYSVKRWGWDGMYSYIGTVRTTDESSWGGRALKGTPKWWTHEVASRTFYGRESGRILNVRHPYVSHEGPFDTQEAAADRLWELYEMPR